MKHGEQWVLQWALATMALGGAAIVAALALDAAAQASDQKSLSGAGSTHAIGVEARGEELYNASCVVCHGQRATGGIGPRLVGNAILSNEQAFRRIMAEGRHMMPPLKDAVTEQQLADIRAWLKTLR